MPAPLVELLAAHLSRRGLTGADSDQLVFTMPEGGPLVYQNWRNRHWLPACRAVGLEGLGFHDLRRLNATGLVMEGVDVKTAQARLGHSDPRLTLAVYAQATTEADRAAADRLGTRFMSPRVPDARDGRAMDARWNERDAQSRRQRGALTCGFGGGPDATTFEPTRRFGRLRGPVLRRRPLPALR